MTYIIQYRTDNFPWNYMTEPLDRVLALGLIDYMRERYPNMHFCLVDAAQFEKLNIH
jgi:hypothetical protein